MLKSLEGKKSYLVAGALVVYGVLGVLLGQLELNDAIQLVLNGLGLSALRASIK